MGHLVDGLGALVVTASSMEIRAGDGTSFSEQQAVLASSPAGFQHSNMTGRSWASFLAKQLHEFRISGLRLPIPHLSQFSLAKASCH